MVEEFVERGVDDAVFVHLDRLEIPRGKIPEEVASAPGVIDVAPGQTGQEWVGEAEVVDVEPLRPVAEAIIPNRTPYRGLRHVGANRLVEGVSRASRVGAAGAHDRSEEHTS